MAPIPQAGRPRLQLEYLPVPNTRTPSSALPMTRTNGISVLASRTSHPRHPLDCALATDPLPTSSRVAPHRLVPQGEAGFRELTGCPRQRGQSSFSAASARGSTISLDPMTSPRVEGTRTFRGRHRTSQPRPRTTLLTASDHVRVRRSCPLFLKTIVWHATCVVRWHRGEVGSRSATPGGYELSRGRPRWCSNLDRERSRRRRGRTTSCGRSSRSSPAKFAGRPVPGWACLRPSCLVPAGTSSSLSSRCATTGT